MHKEGRKFDTFIPKVKLEIFSEDTPCDVYSIVVEQSDHEALLNSF